MELRRPAQDHASCFCSSFRALLHHPPGVGVGPALSCKKTSSRASLVSMLQVGLPGTVAFPSSCRSPAALCLVCFSKLLQPCHG